RRLGGRQMRDPGENGTELKPTEVDLAFERLAEAIGALRPPSPSDFIDVRELVPGEAPEAWDGLNVPPSGAGILWVDVDLDRANLKDLHEVLPRLCPGISEEEITDLF